MSELDCKLMEDRGHIFIPYLISSIWQGTKLKVGNQKIFASKSAVHME